MLLDQHSGELAEADEVRHHHAASDLVLSGVLAVIAVVYAVGAFGLPTKSPNQADIGPRAYPLLILALLVLAIASLVLKALRGFISSGHARQAADKDSVNDRKTMLVQLGGLAMVVVTTVIYLELMIPLGFIVATALFLAIQVALIGGWRRYRGVRVLIPLVFACLTSVIVYVLFADSLGVLLPRGIFSL